MFHLLRITSIAVTFLIGAVFGSSEYLESYSIGWSSLDFTYPINASGVCLAIHNNTFYGFGGKQSGSSTSRVKTVYWLDIDNFTPNNENSHSIVWSSYEWQNDAYWAISGFQCFSNALIIDDYAYIVAPVDNDEVMMVFDTISKTQVDMSDYDYIMPYSVDTPCSTTDGSKIYVMGGTDLDVSSTYYKDLWEYDPILDKWTQLADMKVSGRQYGSCNYDSINNRIFIFGGFSSSSGILDSIEYYNIDNNEWILMDTTLRDERYHHSSLIYLNEYNFNNVYSNNNNYNNIINQYDMNRTIIENNNWVFILGGYDSTGTITDKTQIVNIDKMTIAKWSKSGNSDLPVAMRKFGVVWIEETKNNTNNNNDTKVKVISKSIDNNREQISIIIEKKSISIGGFLSDSSSQITTNKIFYGVVTVNQTIIIDNTNEPTLYPTKMPSIMPSDVMTTTGMITTSTIAMVGGGVDTTEADSGSIISGNTVNDESNSVNQESWQMASIGVLFLAILIPFVVISVAYSFHNNGEWKGADLPDYVSIFVGFWQVADFYSDLLFCGMLFWDNNKLFIYCFIFTFGPHIVSNIVSLFQMYQWRQYTIYISKYVNHYDWFIIFLSATAGFYTAIELAQSRLFLWNIFGLQMRRDEYIKLRNYRFWNVVCFENAPQLIIQLLYINEMGTITLVTFNAMFFSIISLLFGTSRQLSQWFEHTSRLNREYVYRARKEYKMEIHNNSIKPYHKYIHKKFESLLSQILRVDTVNVDVYYIKTMRHGLFLYFEINNFRIANSNVNNKKNNNNNNSDETSHTSTAGMDVEKRVETMDIFEKVMNLESVALSRDECLASQFQNDMCHTFGLDFNSFVVTIKNSECDVEYDKRLQRIEMKTQSNNNNNSHNNNNNNNNNTNNSEKNNSSYQSDNKVNVVNQESDINVMISRPNLEAINSLSGSRVATSSNYNGMVAPMNFDFGGNINIQCNNMNGVPIMNMAPMQAMPAMQQQSINMNNQLQLQQQWMAMAMTMATQVAQPLAQAQPGSVNDDAYNDMVNIATQKEGQH